MPVRQCVDAFMRGRRDRRGRREGGNAVDDGRTVLVVDDDAGIVELMRDFLEAAGFRVEEALDARAALALLARQTIDCVLLDVMMPGESGFDLCRQVRRESDIPILFLTAKGQDLDKIRGFGLGADDYIVKSATPPEIVARIKAVLRRTGAREPLPDSLRWDFGRLVIDARAREVHVDGALLSCTPREFDTLCLFAEHPRQVFTYAQLLERFWNGAGDRHTVTVHIARVREKIEANPAEPALIINVWGVGYRFEGQRR